MPICASCFESGKPVWCSCQVADLAKVSLTFSGLVYRVFTDHCVHIHGEPVVQPMVTP
jgi:hypothetical protein